MGDDEFSVHDQPDFQRVYDEDKNILVRKGDLRAVLDIATQSMDFGSGFLDNEQVEVLRRVATILGIDPLIATPANFVFQYVCQAKSAHTWQPAPWPEAKWYCPVCRHTANTKQMPNGLLPGEQNLL